MINELTTDELIDLVVKLSDALKKQSEVVDTLTKELEEIRILSEKQEERFSQMFEIIERTRRI